MKKNVSNQGFSLIEILVAIVIIGILSTVVLLGVIDYVHDSRVTKVQADIVTLESALDLFKMDAGVYPTTEQGFQALIKKPDISPIPKKWRTNGYLKKPKLPKDPWGNDYVYLCPGNHFQYDIISNGADGVTGGEGNNKDIGSWEVEDMQRISPGVTKYLDGASDYPEMAKTAIVEMNRQVGQHMVDNHGIAIRGLMIRHLVMPNRVAGTEKIIKWIFETLPKSTYINIMHQYHVDYKAYDYPKIWRRINKQEYLEAMAWAEEYKLTNLYPGSVNMRELYAK